MQADFVQKRSRLTEALHGSAEDPETIEWSWDKTGRRLTNIISQSPLDALSLMLARFDG
jgi:hypothetical protein